MLGSPNFANIPHEDFSCALKSKHRASLVAVIIIALGGVSFCFPKTFIARSQPAASDAGCMTWQELPKLMLGLGVKVLNPR